MLHHVHAVYNGEPKYVGTYSGRDMAKVVAEFMNRGYDVVTVEETTVELPGFLRRQA